MRTDLRIKRDRIIKKAWKDNRRNTPRHELIEIFTTPLSIPSLYRIINKTNYPIKKKPTRKQIEDTIKAINKA